jgi:hypothetical protein
MALWGPNADDQTAAVLEAAINHACDQGSKRLSILTSRFEESRVRLLHDRGFVASAESRPLYMTVSQPESSFELTGLSFLDSDLAYRF